MSAEERRIEDLIAASSLGTPDAVAMRERTSPEHARRIVERSEEIAAEERHREALDACLAEKILHLVSRYGQACEVAHAEDTRAAHEQAEAIYDQVAALVRASVVATSGGSRDD